MKEYTFRSCCADSQKDKRRGSQGGRARGRSKEEEEIKKEEEAAAAAVAAKANFSNWSSPNWHKMAVKKVS